MEKCECGEELDQQCDGELRCSVCNPCLCCVDMILAADSLEDEDDEFPD